MDKTINTSLALRIQNKSNRLYDFALTQANKHFKKEEYESAIDFIHFAATLAWRTHPGFFHSNEFENILTNIGLKISNQNMLRENLPHFSNNYPEKKKICHILSTAYLTGGHTRLVAHLIDNCRIHCQNQVHSIVITNQCKNKVPEWLINSAKNNSGECIVIPNNTTWLQKAYLLKSLTKEWANIVVLHMHPNDPLPNLAFSSLDWQIPVLFCNHADHVFSLGMSISKVLDIRESGQKITNQERKPGSKSQLLPIPIMDKMIDTNQNRETLRLEARKRLNLPLYDKIVLTIGSEYKYKPALGYNFNKCINKILFKDNTMHIYAIGLPNSGLWKALSKETKGRFHPIGIINNPTILQDYYLAADIYIEGFPMGSLTAMLDAGLYMLPMQRINNPFAPILSGDDIALDQFMSIANNEDEYISGTIKLMQTSTAIRNNLGKKIRDSIIINHCGKAWVEKWWNPIIEQINIESHVNQNIMLNDADQAASKSIQNLTLSLFRWEHINSNLIPFEIPIDALLNCNQISRNVRNRILVYALSMSL